VFSRRMPSKLSFSAYANKGGDGYYHIIPNTLKMAEVPDTLELHMPGLQEYLKPNVIVTMILFFIQFEDIFGY
jgi:hypothetical protein